MNIDNSNKSQSGAYSNASLKEQLQYLKLKELILNYKSRKYGYEGKRKDQFKCDFTIELPNGEQWILFSAASLTSDRLKTKQWDAENIKKIDANIKKAYVVCPDSTKSRENILRYRNYIRSKQDISYVDDILFHSELINTIENDSLGKDLSGRKAAKKGLNFEDLLVKILESSQNMMLWKGNNLVAGFEYHIFVQIMNKLNLSASEIDHCEASNNIPNLPVYKYKDGSTKKGGRAKTDVVLNVYYVNGTDETFTFSCKSTTKPDITIFQFPPKYCVDILEITESDTEDLLVEYVNAGGPKNMPIEKAKLLEARLSSYLDEFNRWALHGTDKDGSKPIQRADYIITRYQKDENEEDEILIESIDECITNQYRLGNNHFGTAFKWTVTSKNKKGEIFPVLKIRIK